MAVAATFTNTSTRTTVSGDAARRRRRRRRAVVGGPVVAAAVAAAVSGLVVVAGWRGADLPAQLFRVELFRDGGFTTWNNQWYGGHHTLGYSVLFPALGAAVGPMVVGAASVVVAAAAVGDLLRRVAPPTAALVGSVAFALVMPANLAVGRLTFALGVALGLVSLVAWSRGRFGSALAAAALTPLASPVAAAFLALAALSVAVPSWRSPRDLLAVADRRGRGPLLAAVALAPVLLLALVFPSGGTFPFAAGALLAGLAATVGLAVTLPRGVPELRAGAVLATAALVAAFAIPTPMGANAARLPMFFALPVVVAVVAPRRPVVAAVGTGLLVLWAWQPAIDAVVRAPDDPTLEPGFHEPLVDALRARGGEDARLEVVPTARHWEVVYVAPHVPLARGWERQLDRRFHPLFYGDDLDPLTYRAWLRDNAVRHVAVPAAELDPSGAREAALVDGGLPYLRPVWEDERWRLYEVIDGVELVSGPADLLDLDVDRVRLRVREPGEVVVRVRHSPHWSLSGPGCLAVDDDGWLLVRADAPGLVVLEQRLDPAGSLVGEGECAAGR